MRRALGIAVFSGMLGVTLFGILLTPVFFFMVVLLVGVQARGHQFMALRRIPSQATDKPRHQNHRLPRLSRALSHLEEAMVWPT